MELDPITQQAIVRRRQKIPRSKANKTKLRELILYISFKSEGDETFGKVKLYKLLFHSDFLAFLRLGSPITGYSYQALPRGPAPKQIQDILNEMEKDENLVIRPRDFFGKTQHKPIALRNVNVEKHFTTRQIALVDELIRKNWGRTASEMSEESHLFAGWKITPIGGEIPYSIALVSRRSPTPSDIAYGRSLEPLAKKCLARDVS